MCLLQRTRAEGAFAAAHAREDTASGTDWQKSLFTHSRWDARILGTTVHSALTVATAAAQSATRSDAPRHCMPAEAERSGASPSRHPMQCIRRCLVWGQPRGVAAVCAGSMGRGALLCAALCPR